MRYQFIEQYKDEFPVVVMCQVLEVSESGYYAWLKRPTCQHQREDAHIKQEIQEIFVLHKGRYGSPRIHRDLRDQGRCISRERVARLMQEGESSPPGRNAVECSPRKETLRILLPQIFCTGNSLRAIRTQNGSPTFPTFQRHKGGFM